MPEEPIPQGKGRIVVPTPDALGVEANLWVDVFKGDERVASAYSGGRAVFDLDPDSYRVRVAYGQPDEHAVRVALGTTTLVAPRARGRLEVSTPDALGVPTNLWIDVYDGDVRAACSYSGGSTHFDLVPSTYRVVVRYTQPEEQRVSVTAGLVQSIQPLVQRGRLTIPTPDALGKGVSIWVDVFDDQTRVACGYSGGTAATFDLLPRSYRVVARYTQHDEVAATARSKADVHVQLRPRGRLTVETPDVAGAPANVWLDVYQGDVRMACGYSGGKTAFDLLPGTYLVKREGAETEREITAGSVVDVRLEAGSGSSSPPPVPHESLFELRFADLVPWADGILLLPADHHVDGDSRPSARFVVMPAGASPASVRIETRDLTDALRAKTTWTIEVNGRAIGPNEALSVPVEGLSCIIRGGPATLHGSEVEGGAAIARRARATHSSSGRTDIEWTEASACDVVARSNGKMTSQRIEVMHGRPKSIRMVRPHKYLGAADLTLPNGDPWAPGARAYIRGVIWDHPSSLIAPIAIPEPADYPIPYVVRGHAVLAASRSGDSILRPDVVADPPVKPPATPAYLVTVVAELLDEGDNPVPLEGGDGDWEVLVGFEWQQHFASALRPFALSSDAPDVARDPCETKWRVRPPTHLPHVLVFHVAPMCAPYVSAETTLLVAASNGTDRIDWKVGFPCEPTTASGRLAHWLVTGDAPSAGYVIADLALSLVPFLGDGKDLLYYGFKRLRKQRIEPIDHVVALLSLAGLALDFFPPAIAANAAAASAKGAMKALRTIDAVPATKLAEAIRDALTKVGPEVDKVKDWQTLTKTAEFGDYVKLIEELGDLASAVKRAEQLGVARRLLTAVGLTVGAIQLRPLLRLLIKYGVEKMIDVLEAMQELEEDV